MRALIVDDEPVARRVLREELQLLAVEIAGEAENGAQALMQIRELTPDLVLVDIEMPVMSGFEMLKQLSTEHAPAIIMVTAYDEYAIRAFDAGAIDYLLKPVSQERLQRSVERARRIVSEPGRAAAEIEHLRAVALPAYSREGGEVNKIVGKSGGEFFLLKLSEVLALQAEGDLTWIVTSRQRYQATQNLRALEMRLAGGSFRRIHRNALVNVEQIRKMSMITSQRWLLTLNNGQEFIVSKRQARNVREVLHW